jgi:hypothetical protein
VPGLYAKVDVGFPDDPKTVEAGDLAELAYLRCVLRGRENLTDGVIDRRVLARWLAGIRGKPTSHMDKLVQVGLLEVHPDGWRIPHDAWVRWNPLKADVEAKRAEDAERKRQSRESKKRPSGQAADSDTRPDTYKQQPEPETEPAACVPVVTDPVEVETLLRVAARRQRGEVIGQPLVALIRGDVEREFAVVAAAENERKCGGCGGWFIDGSGFAHALDCPTLAVLDGLIDAAGRTA